MPIDCYVTSCASDLLRTHLARATLAALSADPALAVVLLRTKDADVHAPHGSPRSAYGFDITPKDFQKFRRTEAAARSLSAWFVMADDDVLPMSENWVSRGLQIAEKHPEFGIIGLRERGVNYLPYDGFSDDEVEETAEAGGLYFTRRGLLLENEWPAVSEENDYDRRQADVLRSKGLKVGIFKGLVFNHIGLGHSTATWNEIDKPKKKAK